MEPASPSACVSVSVSLCVSLINNFIYFFIEKKKKVQTLLGVVGLPQNSWVGVTGGGGQRGLRIGAGPLPITLSSTRWGSSIVT